MKNTDNKIHYMEEEDLENEINDNDKDYNNGSKLPKSLGFFDMEANREDFGHGNRNRNPSWRTILVLAFQCIGIVYGDLGTSPLYVLSSIFPDGIEDPKDLYGALSLIIYSILILTVVKYVFIVLSANDNGDGGTFALYSLICRHAKVNMIPNQQAEDRKVSNYSLELPNLRAKRAARVKSFLENSKTTKYFLLFITMLGVSMVLGDGVLTPCISVLSAVGGIKVAASSLTDTKVMWISVVILILLFQIQRFGTDKIGYTFAPVITLWFLFIGVIGIYNFIKYDPSIIKAFNPWYIVRYFQKNKKKAWISLGGVILCLTGSEALFADLGHFHIRSVQLSSCSVLVPAVLLAYLGQCSYLRKHPDEVLTAFYSSIPKPLYWPQFIVAVLAAIIASQSLISASFSIVQQSVALGCFPWVKVVHTSEKIKGQIYIPEINTLLMILCIVVTLGMQSTVAIGNAYGICVTIVFVITSLLLILIMILVWKTHIILIIIYTLTICVIELVFLSSVLYKFVDGGYIPLCFAIVVVFVMFVWFYGYRKKYMHELENMVSADRVFDIISNPKTHRIKGLGLFYTQLVQGIPPIFNHYISSVQAIHSVLVFVTIKSLPVSRVPPNERCLFQRIKPGESIFQCVVRYGYTDSRKDQETFEEVVVAQLKEFIKEDELINGEEVDKELAFVDEVIRDGGIVYLMGDSELQTSKGAGLAKQLMVDYLHNWLSRVVRQPKEFFLVPRKCLLRIGMTYEV